MAEEKSPVSASEYLRELPGSQAFQWHSDSSTGFEESPQLIIEPDHQTRSSRVLVTRNIPRSEADCGLREPEIPSRHHLGDFCDAFGEGGCAKSSADF
jgi:hypothetical protein